MYLITINKKYLDGFLLYFYFYFAPSTQIFLKISRKTFYKKKLALLKKTYTSTSFSEYFFLKYHANREQACNYAYVNGQIYYKYISQHSVFHDILKKLMELDTGVYGQQRRSNYILINWCLCNMEGD